LFHPGLLLSRRPVNVGVMPLEITNRVSQYLQHNISFAADILNYNLPDA